MNQYINEAHSNRQSSVASAEWMTWGFAILFFGAGAVQQYIAIWYADRGLAPVGIVVLILIYLCFFLGSFQAHRLVSRWGARACCLFSVWVYSAFLAAVCINSAFLAYTAALLAGLSAALLWTTQNVVMNSIDNATERTSQVCRFWKLYPLGTGLGTFALGLLIGRWSYTLPILAFAGIALSSLFCFSMMDTTQAKESGTLKGWDSPSGHGVVIGMSITVFYTRVVYALIISQIPLDIANTIGPGQVGLLTASFFIMPVLVSKFVAKVVDRKGLLFSGSLGFALSLLSLTLFLVAIVNAGALLMGVFVAAAASSVLNPVSNLLPGLLQHRYNQDLPKISGTFSIAGSAGILCGLILMSVFPGRTVYTVGSILLVATWIVFVCNRNSLR